LSSNTDIEKLMEEKDKSRKAIADVISAMAFSMEQEGLKQNIENIQKVCEFYKNDCHGNNDYYATCMSLICSHFNDVPAIPWLLKHNNVHSHDKFIIQSIFNGLFQHWVYTAIENHESHNGGQGDKESFIVKKVIEAIDKQENLSLYAEYKDKPGEQAYWSPKYFKDTDQVRVEFLSWWKQTDMTKYVYRR